MATLLRRVAGDFRRSSGASGAVNRAAGSFQSGFAAHPRSLIDVLALRWASTLVVAEHTGRGAGGSAAALKPPTLSAVAAARKLGGPVAVLVAGSGDAVADVAAAVAKIEGVDEVITTESPALDHALPEPLAALLTNLAAQRSFSHVLAASSTFSRNVLPRVAALLDAAMVSDVVEIVDETTFVRPIYAGNALATVRCSTPSPAVPTLLTVRATSFPAASSAAASAPKTTPFDFQAMPQVRSMHTQFAAPPPPPQSQPAVRTTSFPATSFLATSFPATSFLATSFPATSFPATSFPATSFPATSSFTLFDLQGKFFLDRHGSLPHPLCLHPNAPPLCLHPNAPPLCLHPNAPPLCLHPNAHPLCLHPNAPPLCLHPNAPPLCLHPNAHPLSVLTPHRPSLPPPPLLFLPPLSSPFLPPFFLPFSPFFPPSSPVLPPFFPLFSPVLPSIIPAPAADCFSRKFLLGRAGVAGS
ncbi:unnamed protein product [Closterium sp. Naga37s-1]|nr:unnamed protein product [Closterium sp. Naga37s-1]